MATLVSAIETKVRLRLAEPTAKFWSSDELVGIIDAGIRDLWRDAVQLKQEYYLTVSSSVTLAADTATLSSVPSDIHKVYQIRPNDISSDSTNRDLRFEQADYNSDKFNSALKQDNVDPTDYLIYYAIAGNQGPVSAPTIYVAPKVTSAVTLNFAYIPTLGTISAASTVPIPGEADNALVAWTVAHARAKEREDSAPDPGWLAVYATEKAHLMLSLGQRGTQDPEFADAVFEQDW